MRLNLTVIVIVVTALKLCSLPTAAAHETKLLPSLFRDKTVVADELPSSSQLSSLTQVVDQPALSQPLSLAEWMNKLGRAKQELDNLHHRQRSIPPTPLTGPWFQFIPPYLGSAMLDEKPVVWSDACFANAAVKADMVASSVNLTLSLENHHGVVCEDYLLFATATTWHAQVFRKPGTHVIQWHGMSTDELNDVKHNGFRVFRFNGTLPEMVSSVYETLLLFVGADTGNASVPEAVANANRDFLRENANYDMVERTSGFQLAEQLPESTFQSGDFLAIIRLDGIDPMLAWAMGAHTGHTAMTVWEQGQLYVMESTNRTNYWPTSGVQKTPWSTWIRQAQEADFNVVHIPLTDQARQLFDVDAALSFFNNYAEGLDYGFNNMLYGWIDTPEDNFPGSLTAEMGMVLFGVLDAILPPADKIWLAGMNMRLNTTDLNTIQCYAEAERRGINFTSLITIPEQDWWRYSNGLNMVCDVFVCMMLKEGGMFGDLKNEIQCTEFTNWDVYSLDFYDASPNIPQICKDADPGMPHCQIMGKYRMTLPGVGTISYFSHMREHCPSLAPDYAMRNELREQC